MRSKSSATSVSTILKPQRNAASGTFTSSRLPIAVPTKPEAIITTINDRGYVTREECYPGLVVHGPLIATLLVDLVRRNAPDARIAEFSFRAVSPLFDGNRMSVNATPPDADGVVKLWAASADGDLAMTAQARLA